MKLASILFTGSPAGVGNGRTPAEFLTEGDEVVVRGQEFGE